MLVKGTEVNHRDAASGRHLVPSLHNQLLTVLGQLAPDALNKLIAGDEAVAIDVEVIEKTLELRALQVVATLLEEPLSLVLVKSVVAISVVFLEHAGQVLSTVHALGSQGSSKLLQNLAGLLSLHSELRLHVRVIARALKSHKASTLFVVDLAGTVGVKSLEKAINFDIIEVATELAQGFFELKLVEGAIAVAIKVLKQLASGLTLVLGSVSPLPQLFENDVFNLVHASGRHIQRLATCHSRGHSSVEAPSLGQHLVEVGLLLLGQNAVKVQIKVNEALLADLAILTVAGHHLTEFRIHLLHSLLAGLHARVATASELLLESIK